MKGHREEIVIEGHEVRIPDDTREQINDKIHDVLRENHGIDARVVYWRKPVTLNECAECGYTDVRRNGTECPQCGDGVMV